MIVTRTNFREVLEEIKKETWLAVDTETTGISPYHDSELFSIIIASDEKAWYFNFNEYPDLDEECNLNHQDFRVELHYEIFNRDNSHYYMHNAKFDLSMLKKAGFDLWKGGIHDTMAIARLLDSERMPGRFSLKECLKDIGLAKDDAVEKYIQKNRLWTEVVVSGKKTTRKNMHYQLVPFELIVPYGEQDAFATFKLGEYQRQKLEDLGLSKLYAVESQLTKVVFDMEQLGVKIDVDFTKRAQEKAWDDVTQAMGSFKTHTGKDFIDSGALYKEVFKEENVKLGAVTPTGKQNAIFDSDELATFSHPAAKDVLKYREAKSSLNYFLGFEKEADKNSVIHASFNQHATSTGRFSSSRPNLQNLTKADDSETDEFLVRRAIIPRGGMVFHMLDYDQMEYRLMLEYAALYAQDEFGVLNLISKVNGGLDVHQATAEIAGITRKEAKTTNFALLYGSGNAALAERLKVSERTAAEIRRKIFQAAPEINIFINQAKLTAEKRGWVYNWCGRRYDFPDARFAYRAPNYIIQGGCADIVKIAMNMIDGLTRYMSTKLVLTIHDELVLEGPPESSEHVIPEVKKIMESVYPSKKLKLTVGIDHSFKSLADKVEGIACGTETGDEVLAQDKTEVRRLAEVGVV